MAHPEANISSKAAPELARRIRQGDAAAFEILYRMEYLNLVHFSDSYLKDPEKAKDVSQESLLTLWEHRAFLDPEKNVRAFLYTIARNKTLDELYLRRRRSRSPEETENALSLLEDNAVEDYINRLDLGVLINRIWQSLPSKIGRTFAMSREEGLRNKEIARQEGISEKAVEYRMKVALRHFRKYFEKLLG